jgi:hypothetical protein
VVTAHNLLEARQLRQQADSALAESLAEEARARSLQGATPRLPLPADALKAISRGSPHCSPSAPA